MQSHLDEGLLEARADEVRALRLENAERLRRAEEMAAALSQGAASSGDACEPTFSKAAIDLALQYRGVPLLFDQRGLHGFVQAAEPRAPPV